MANLSSHYGVVNDWQKRAMRSMHAGKLANAGTDSRGELANQPIPSFSSAQGQLSPLQVDHLQRTVGNRAVSRLVSSSRPTQPGAPIRNPISGPPRVMAKRFDTLSPRIQRAGNWDNFKGFLGEEWGEGGAWRRENEWALDALDPRDSYAKHANKGGAWNTIKGVGAGIGHTLYGLPFAALGGLLSTTVRGVKTLGAGAYYGARGLGSLAGEEYSAGKEGLSNLDKNVWSPLSGDQKSGLLSNTGLGALGGVSSLGAGISGLSQQDLTRDESLVDVDKSTLGNSTTSSVGQGFGAGAGMIGGLAGLVNTGRGISNLFGKKSAGKGYQRLTRGLGRTTAGLGQTFAGITTAGRSIATLHNMASPAAQFMAAAALPAQAAMSGVDLVRGTYGMGKAFKRQKNLRGLQQEFSKNEDQPEMAEMARMAKQYQPKRKRAAGINMASGILGGLGAGLTLSGVGAVAGLPLLAAAGLLKLGGSLYGTVRDKTWGRESGKIKAGKELQWATYAAKNYKDVNIKQLLSTMGAEDTALDDDKLEKMTEEERRLVMLKQLMKR